MGKNKYVAPGRLTRTREVNKMREILFRAKRIDNGEWVRGYYYSKTLIHAGGITRLHGYILTLSGNEIEVISETVSQFTGLTDKNGKKIFEGDILKCVGNKRIFKGVLMDFEEVTHVSVVEWWNSYCNCGYRVKNQNGKTMMIKQSSLIGMNAEIIGNIFDNPELIKE